MAFLSADVFPPARFILLPEVVAGDQGLIGILVIQAAEAVLGLAVMGPSVQVAIPVDLDAHDSSLMRGEQLQREVDKSVGYGLCSHQALSCSVIIAGKVSLSGEDTH